MQEASWACWSCGGKRRATFANQLTAELQAYLGETDASFKSLRGAVDAGLVDITWLERCPLFDEMRSDPRFAEIRRDVVDRIARIAGADGAAVKR